MDRHNSYPVRIPHKQYIFFKPLSTVVSISVPDKVYIFEGDIFLHWEVFQSGVFVLLMDILSNFVSLLRFDHG